MEFKKISEMTTEELQKLPLVSVRVARIVIKDRKTNRITSVRHEAQVQIHDLLIKRVNLKQSDYGLLALASGKVSANEISLKAPIHFTKGERKNGETYWMFECRISSDVTVKDFFSYSEAKLLSALKSKNEFPADFHERPITDIPEIENNEDVINL